MALPPTYSARVTTSASPRAQRRVSRGGLGDGLTALGREGSAAMARRMQAEQQIEESEARIRERELARERSRRAVVGTADLGERRLEYRRRIEEAKSKTDPGASGWEATATEIRIDVFGDFLSQFSDDEDLYLRMGDMVQSITQRQADEAYAWEIAKRGEWEGESYERARRIEADGLISNPDLFGEAAGQMKAVRDVLDLDGTGKAQLEREDLELFANAALQGFVAQERYDEAEAFVNSEALAGLHGNRKKSWLDTIAAGRAVQVRTAERAESAARDAWRDQWRVFEQRLERGYEIESGEVQDWLARGGALGIEQSELERAGFLAIDSKYASSAREMESPVLNRELADLARKRASGALTAEEARYQAALDQELARRDEGKAADLGGLKSNDPAERLAALESLSQMPVDERMRVAEKAGEPAAGILAALPARQQGVAIQGRQVLDNDKNAFMPRAPGKTEGDATRLEAEFRSVLGPDLTTQLITNPAYGSMMQAAAQLYAGSRAGAGASGWSQADFRKAVNVVFGARQRADGRVAGGLGRVRERTVMLPDGWTAEEVDQQLSRFSFATARYADGSAARKADVLANFSLQYTGTAADGRARYVMVDDRRRVLMNEVGQPYFLDFRNR